MVLFRFACQLMYGEGRVSFFLGKKLTSKFLNEMCISFDIHLDMDSISPNYMKNGDQLLIQAAF